MVNCFLYQGVIPTSLKWKCTGIQEAFPWKFRSIMAVMFLNHVWFQHFTFSKVLYLIKYFVICEWHCLIGIATGDGLGGPGYGSQWGWHLLCPSRLAARLNQPPVRWVLGKGTGAWRWPPISIQRRGCACVGSIPPTPLLCLHRHGMGWTLPLSLLCYVFRRH